MIKAEQARKDLESNKQADYEKDQSAEAKRQDQHRKELARALKEDVPKVLAKIEADIYKAVAKRENSVKYTETATTVSDKVLNEVQKQLTAHGYRVEKDYDSGTYDASDEVRNIPYADYILNVKW